MFKLFGEISNYANRLIQMDEESFNEFISDFDNIIHPLYNEIFHVYFIKCDYNAYV